MHTILFFITTLSACLNESLDFTKGKSDDDFVDIYSKDRRIVLEESHEQWLSDGDEKLNSYAGSGVSFFHLNADKYLDMIVSRWDGIHIYINDQSNGFTKIGFQEMNDVIPVVVTGIPDVDAQSNSFFVSTTFGDDQWLTLSQDDITLQNIPDSSAFSAHSAWMDLEKDGFFEIAVAGYVDEKGYAFQETFETGVPFDGEPNLIYTTDTEGIPTQSNTWQLPALETEPFSFSLLWLPLNNDDNWDLYAINDVGMINQPNTLFWNTGDGLVWEQEGKGTNIPMFGMGVAQADINEDQIPDLFVTNIGNPVQLMSSEDGWIDMALAMGLGLHEDQSTCWGADWHDVNNDGELDLWVGCGPLPEHEDPNMPNKESQPDSLFINSKDTYIDMASEWGVASKGNTRAGGFADLNNDGCWELIQVPLDGPIEIFFAKCTDNHWLDISLYIDDVPAIGATVRVSAGSRVWTEWLIAGGSSFSTFHPFQLHFGLGAWEKVDISIIWPDGSVQEMNDVPVDQHITVIQE